MIVFEAALYFEVAAALIVIFTVPLLRNVIFPLEDTCAIFLLLEIYVIFPAALGLIVRLPEEYLLV